MFQKEKHLEHLAVFPDFIWLYKGVDIHVEIIFSN